MSVLIVTLGFRAKDSVQEGRIGPDATLDLPGGTLSVREDTRVLRGR